MSDETVTLRATKERVRRFIVHIIRQFPIVIARRLYRAYGFTLTAIGLVAPEWVTTYFGARMFCDPNDLIQNLIFHFGVWEPEVSSLIERQLSPGDVFVDLGANIGYDALLASSCVGKTGRVVAVEALPRTFECLKRNLAANETASNVRAVNMAVSDRTGKTDVYDIWEGNIGAATTVASRGGSLAATVDAAPLTQILTPDERKRLKLIKMDVEGAELPVLRQLLDTLSSYPPTMSLIVEVNPSEDEDIEGWRAVFERLKAAEFSAYAIDNFYDWAWYLTWRKPARLRPIESVPTHLQDVFFTRSPVHA